MLLVMRSALCGLAILAATALGASAGPLPAAHVEISRSRDPALGEADPGCASGTIPDGDVCVHLPPDVDDEPEVTMVSNAHRERSGRWAIYDQIPRRPDRPADYEAYVYPVPPGIPGGHLVVSGYDLDRPDDAQRRGWRLHATGHGGVDLPQAKGTPIHMVPLEHQLGDADVLYVGPYFGTTVIARSTVREASGLHDYLIIFGHLDRSSPGLVAGSVLKSGDLVGTVGDTGSPELVHLHLEMRRVRDGVDVLKKARSGPGQLTDGSVSVVCDPRNVLPLK